MNKAVVSTVIQKCLQVKRGEHLLIVSDDQLYRLARSFFNIVKAQGITAVLLEMPAAKMHAEEPPKEITAALKVADAALLFTTMSLSHTLARKRASGKFGTRIISLPGITSAIFHRAIQINYPALRKQANAVARRLTQGKQLTVHTDRGTRLSMSIRGRSGFTDNGYYVRPGAFGNLPAGEACIAPCEGTSQGTLVVDGSASLVGRLRQPAKIIIKDGYAKNIPLAKIASAIKPLGKCALNIAEFGIGLNPQAKLTGNVLEDEKARQTAHLAIGANISFGGKVGCPCHLDFVFLNPRIFIDGKKLLI